MLPFCNRRSFAKGISLIFSASTFAFLLFAPQADVLAQTASVVHWINDSGQDGLTLLNEGSNFITSFKATNDVQVKLLSGSVNSIFQEAFTVGGPNINNPAFLTNFVGLAANGTGDGSHSHLKCLETALGGAVALQFDFAVPLTSNDRLLITDVDSGEVYGVQAFFAGQPLNLSGWGYTAYSGETSQLPDSTWPTWNANSGTLSSNTTANLNEPLSVLTPSQSVDRVIISRSNQGGGSAAIQFVNLSALNSGPPVLQIQSAGTNAVLSWLESFANYSLYTTTNLLAPVTWAPIGTQPSLNSHRLMVTNFPSARTRFYRLQQQ